MSRLLSERGKRERRERAREKEEKGVIIWAPVSVKSSWQWWMTTCGVCESGPYDATIVSSYVRESLRRPSVRTVAIVASVLLYNTPVHMNTTPWSRPTPCRLISTLLAFSPSEYFLYTALVFFPNLSASVCMSVQSKKKKKKDSKKNCYINSVSVTSFRWGRKKEGRRLTSYIIGQDLIYFFFVIFPFSLGFFWKSFLESFF